MRFQKPLETVPQMLGLKSLITFCKQKSVFVILLAFNLGWPHQPHHVFAINFLSNCHLGRPANCKRDIPIGSVNPQDARNSSYNDHPSSLP